MEGETLDDMSLSSSSSLDPNHASQEYMDDFDDLGERETHERTFSDVRSATDTLQHGWGRGQNHLHFCDLHHISFT